MKTHHDPVKIINDLKQLLQSDKKKIGFLFGAGTSCAKKDDKSLIVPSIPALTSIVFQTIEKSDDKNDKEQFNPFIQSEIVAKTNINIEEVLSKIEILISVIGNETHKGLEKDELEKLALRIKEIIRNNVSVHDVDPIPYDSLLQVDFARWIGLAERQFGIEIFTTNYDYLFELGLEYYNIPYYDGFIGSYEPFFSASTVETYDFMPKVNKLWKLHGSIGWALVNGYKDKEDKRIIRKQNGTDFYIYPSLYKYSNTKKEPYVSLIDRLCKFLQQDDAVLITCGYAFNDKHLNERIMTAINQRDSNSCVFALLYDKEITESEKGKIKIDYCLDEKHPLYTDIASLNNKISVLGMKQGVINQKILPWKLSKEPNISDYDDLSIYFDEEVSLDQEIEIGIDKEKKKGAEAWSGYGVLNLPDFKFFVEFLNQMVTIYENTNAKSK